METSTEPLPFTPLLPCSHVTILLTSTSGRESSRPGLVNPICLPHTAQVCVLFCACGHVQVHAYGGARPGMWSGLFLTTWGGKRGLMLGPLWKSWGRATWGPGTETAGTQGCGCAPCLSEAPEEPARLKGRGKGHVALDTCSVLPSTGTTLMAFPSSGTVS